MKYFLIFKTLCVASYKVLLYQFDDSSLLSGFRDVVGYMFNFLFGSFWIIPVYIATRVANCLWWQDIADALFKLRPNISHQVRFQIRNGTDQLSSFQGQTSPETFKWSFSMLLTDLCYSITIDTFFLIQASKFYLVYMQTYIP